MTNREPCSMGKRRFERTAPRVGSQRQRACAEASALLRLWWKITPQMILLSHERQCFSRTTSDWHDADRLHPLCRTEPDETSHVSLEHSCDSLRNENAGSARQLDRRQPVARSQDLLKSATHVCGGLPLSDRLHTSSQRIRWPPGDVPRRRSWRGPPTGRTGSRIPSALLVEAATGGAAVVLATALPVGSPAD
jgi:hypothetical protein